MKSFIFLIISLNSQSLTALRNTNLVSKIQIESYKTQIGLVKCNEGYDLLKFACCVAVK